MRTKGNKGAKVKEKQENKKTMYV